MKLSREEKLKIYPTVSNQIKAYLASVESTDYIFNLGNKHGLNYEKIESVSEEITSVLYGATSISNFEQNLGSIVSLEKNKAANLVSEIKNEIFSKLEKFIKPISSKNLLDKKTDIPQNLPVANEGQKIPTFSVKTENVMTNDKFQITKNETEKIVPSIQNQTPANRNQPKPSYTPPSYVEPVKGMSQDDIFANRQNKPKPYVPPTRDFKYRDEKIGGVNIDLDKNNEEISENISREDLIKDIENPVRSAPSGGVAQKPAYKNNDPYREPIE